MRFARSLPLIIYWDADETVDRTGHQGQPPAALRRVQQLAEDSDATRPFEYRDLSAGATRLEDRCRDGRAFLTMLQKVVADAGMRPIAVVVGTMPNSMSAIFTDLEVGSEAVFEGEDGFDLRDRNRRAVGLGLHLLLRFPEVWPIFVISVQRDRESFFSWLFKLASEGMIPDDQMTREAQALQDVLREQALSIIRRCHILNPRQSGICAIDHFLNHRSLLFDPTGLRSLAKAALWRRARGTGPEYEGSVCGPAAALLLRAVNNAVVVDEEEGFTLIGAYSAYRQGRRCWAITDGRDFVAGPWRNDITNDARRSTLLIRDFHLRLHGHLFDARKFIAGSSDQEAPAVPLDLADFRHWDIAGWSLSGELLSIRGEETLPDFGYWHDASSVHHLIISADEPPEGATRDGYSHSLSKPFRSTYFVTSSDCLPLQEGIFQDCASLIPAGVGSPTMIQRVLAGDIEVKANVRHAARPIFHQLAAALIERADSVDQDTVYGCVHRAILYGEAFELLAGRNAPTAINAFTKLQAAEASLEGLASGMFSANIDLKPRQQEIEEVLVRIFGRSRSGLFAVDRVYDAGLQIWSAIIGAYRRFEAFNAANDAQVESLVYVGGEAYRSRRFDWAQLPLMGIGFWMAVLSPTAIGHGLGRAAKQVQQYFSTEVPVAALATGHEQQIRSNLRRKRGVFRLLARPWDFIWLYIKFLVAWVFTLSAIHFVATSSLRDGVLSQIWLAVSELRQSSYRVVLSALALEPISPPLFNIAAWEWIYKGFEAGFLVWNFIFLTMLVAVIVKFVLRG